MVNKLTVIEKTLLGLAFLVIVAFCIMQSLFYISGTDEAWQLETAANIANGEGAVGNFSLLGDLSAPMSTLLVAWPVGYSLFIALFASLGIPVLVVAGIVKTCFLLFSWYTWFQIGKRYLQTPAIKICFAAFLLVLFLYLSYASTDLFVVGLFALIIKSFIKNYHQHSAKNLLLISGYLCLMVFFKYTANLVVIVVNCWLLLMANRNILARVKDCFTVSILPTALFLAIAFYNKSQTGQANTLTNQYCTEFFFYPISWFVSLGYNFLQTLFVEPFKINRILGQLGVTQYANLIKGLALVCSMGAVSYGVWKSKFYKTFLFKLIPITVVAYAGGLFLLIGIYTGEGTEDFIPLLSFRYNMVYIPMLFVGLFVWLEKIGLRKVAILLTALLLLVGVRYVSNEWKTKQALTAERTSYISAIEKLKSNHDFEAEFSIMHSPHFELLHPELAINNFRLELQDVFAPAHYFSKKTLVTLVDTRPETQKTVQKFVQHYQMDSVAVGTNRQIYWKVFEPKDKLIKL